MARRSVQIEVSSRTVVTYNHLQASFVLRQRSVSRRLSSVHGLSGPWVVRVLRLKQGGIPLSADRNLRRSRNTLSVFLCGHSRERGRTHLCDNQAREHIVVRTLVNQASRPMPQESSNQVAAQRHNDRRVGRSTKKTVSARINIQQRQTVTTARSNRCCIRIFLGCLC